MKKIFILLALSSSFSMVNAQVGIGTSTPNANSILDLTNSSEKLLMLPVPSTATPATFNTEAMMFYFGDYIYLKTSATTFNVLTPWAFDGTPANGTYTPSGTRVGIGIATSALDSINLKVAGYGEVRASSGSPAGLSIGTLSAQHLLFDTDEILSKSNATTPGTLKLQEGGGTVQVGQSAAVPSSLNVYGSILQNNMALIPVGTIVLWYGQFDGDYPMPGGVANTNWHICDGTNGTPNLSNQFIVASDMSGASGNSSPLATNGQSMIKTVVLPQHTHTINHGHSITDPGHSHSFELHDEGGGGYIDDSGNDYYNTGSTSSNTTGITVDNHTGSSGATGTAGATMDITPAASRLAYIMKIN